MSTKKNIDQLFKERFENHEVQPPAQVWENIQAAMREEKKDRKVVPLWWKVGGIAALLAVMFTIGSVVFKTSDTNGFVEETNESKDKNQEISPYIKTDNEFNTNNKAVEVAEDPAENTAQDTATSIEASANQNATTQKHTEQISKAQLAEQELQQHISAQKPEINPNANAKSNTAVATGTTHKQGLNSNLKEALLSITSTPNSDVLDAKQKAETEVGLAQSRTNNPILNNTDISTNLEQELHPQSTTAIAAETEVKIKESEDEENEKPSIFDAIEEQKEAAKEAVAIDNTPSDRWEVSPNFAPVYYNTASEGSSIDASFADNDQSGEVNISYGVAVSYALNDRLSIRSGINNVSVGYETSGLELGEGEVMAALASVDYNRSGEVIIPQDKGTFASQDEGANFGDIQPKSTSGEVFVNQNINYYEVPLELKYALFNTKIGVNLIGGLSTLFLGDNDVTVHTEGFSETLGEANNLSNVSFSTNVGLGFDYKFSSKFKFNLEPMFKYQLNSYTDSSVNFQPYYVGVYTGLSYKF